MTSLTPATILTQARPVGGAAWASERIDVTSRYSPRTPLNARLFERSAIFLKQLSVSRRQVRSVDIGLVNLAPVLETIVGNVLRSRDSTNSPRSLLRGHCAANPSCLGFQIDRLAIAHHGYGAGPVHRV